MNLAASIQIISPEIFLICSTTLLLLYGLYSSLEKTPAVFKGGIGIILLTAAILFGYASNVKGLAFDSSFVSNDFTFLFKILILIGAGGTLAVSLPYLTHHGSAKFEYPVLMLLAVLGMFIMVSANSMLVLYMGLELQSLSLYILAAFIRNNVRASEAGLKYFVLGALSSGMLLFGISLIYGYTGAINFDEISLAISGEENISYGFIVGMIFVLVAIAFKISAVPFHMWTPDVYQGAPTPVTAFFATAPKIAAFGLFIRLLIGPFNELSFDWAQIIYFLSVASMIVGAFAALNQNSIKRLLAFSSINNIGYALIGLSSGLLIGVNATITYMIIYLIMTIGIFALILCLNNDGKMIDEIEDLAGLSKSNPIIAYSIAILLFSVAGIPPMAGFFGKLIIFNAAIEAEQFYLTVIGVLTSVVAAYYYLRLIQVMFFEEPQDIKLPKSLGMSRPLVFGVSVVFALFFILKPDSIPYIVEAATASLMING